MEDYIKEGVTNFRTVVFEDFNFVGLEVYVKEINPYWGVGIILIKNEVILNDGLKDFLLRICMNMGILLIVINRIPSIELIVVVIVIGSFKELIFKKNSLKVLVLINGWIFTFSIGAVVIVELIIPTTVLVEEVNVLAALNFKTLTVSNLCECLETMGIWSGVVLHWIKRLSIKFKIKKVLDKKIRERIDNKIELKKKKKIKEKVN